MEHKWVRNNVDLNAINNQIDVVVLQNSGVLEDDFYSYATNFFYSW